MLGSSRRIHCFGCWKEWNVIKDDCSFKSFNYKKPPNCQCFTQCIIFQNMWWRVSYKIHTAEGVQVIMSSKWSYGKFGIGNLDWMVTRSQCGRCTGHLFHRSGESFALCDLKKFWTWSSLNFPLLKQQRICQIDLNTSRLTYCSTEFLSTESFGNKSILKVLVQFIFQLQLLHIYKQDNYCWACQ